MLKTRTRTTRPTARPRAKLAQGSSVARPASRPAPRTRAPAGARAAGRPGRAPSRASFTVAARPKRPLRVVVMMSDEEHQQLLLLCEDDVRPVASWFRVVVRRAWEARRPRRGAPGVFQRQEDDGQRRRVEVWTRLSEVERDQLDVLAGEEDVSVAVWYRRRLREDWASRFGGSRRRLPSGQHKAPAAKPPPRAAAKGGTKRARPTKAAAKPRRTTPRR